MIELRNLALRATKIAMHSAWLLTAIAHARPTDLNAEAIQSAIRTHVKSHPSTEGLAITVHFREPAPTAKKCEAPLAVSSSHRRLLGNIVFQVRCPQPNWSVTAHTRIEARGEYWLADRYLPIGTIITPKDIRQTTGDLAPLAEDIIRSDSKILGRTLTRSISAGSPLTLHALKESTAIKSGDTVRVIAIGGGFSISSEGTASSSGAIGETVKLKLSNGQQVAGQVVRPGVVELRLDQPATSRREP